MGESKIVVRCALQSFSDQTVICPHDWTVLRVKEHLEAICPSQPDPKRQRLIYAGKCLDDESKIGLIIRPDYVDKSQLHHIFHLVYTPSVSQWKNHLPPPKRQRVTETTQRQNNTERPLPSTNEGVAFTGFAFPPAQTDQSTAQHQWMLAQQQMYNAYMVNYMNYLNQLYGAAYGGSALYPGLATAALPAPPADAAPVPAAQPEAGAEPAMNAQGGLVADDDELRDRDWLDWVYMGSRASLLVMILYFYSSLERFTFVMLSCLLLYAFQAGWFNLRGNNNHRDPAPAEEQQQQQQPEPETPEPETRQEALVEVEQTPWVVFWSTCFTFITTFFTSLVPERPPPLNVN